MVGKNRYRDDPFEVGALDLLGLTISNQVSRLDRGKTKSRYWVKEQSRTANCIEMRKQ